MDAQQYSLSWNHFHSNLSNGFQVLLREQDMVDVTLAVGGKYLKAHKMVLSICSPYFKELFQVNPCKHPIVVLQDMPYRIFKSLLTFMYQGEVKVAQTDLGTFMKVAEILKVKGLTESDDGIEEMNSKSSASSSPLLGAAPEKRPELSQAHPLQYKKKEPSNTNGLFFHSRLDAEHGLSKMRPIRPKSLRPTPTAATATTTPPPRTAPAKQFLKSSGGVSILKKPKLDAPPSAASPAPSTSTRVSSPAITEKKPEELDEEERLQQAKREALAMFQLQQKDMPKKVEKPPEPEEPSPLEPLVEVKEEPIDVVGDLQDDSMEGGSPMDMNALVAASLGDSTSSMDTTGDVNDSSMPGRVQLLKSKRGLPVLIYNGHMYTKHAADEHGRSSWLCVKQRILQCGGCLTTSASLAVLSYSGHNHRQLHDIIERLHTHEGSNCGGSSSNSSPSHSHASSSYKDYTLEPTDLSWSNASSSAHS